MRLKFEKLTKWIKKNLKNFGISLLLVFCFFLIIKNLEEEHGFDKILEHFMKHAWLEILVGIALYWLLERKIDNLNEVPSSTQRNIQNILEQFESTHGNIKILDITINSFLKNNSQKFKESIKKVLQGKSKSIQILLLHPDTYASEQRSKDLSRTTKSTLNDMKEGLGKLYQILSELEKELDPSEMKKIKVKLFKENPILIYTSWGKNANFGLLLYAEYDKVFNDTYGVKTTTPLFESFDRYFNNMWDNPRLIDLYDYLLISIKNDSNLKQIFWGGNSENHEFPRYITCKENLAELNSIANKGTEVKIEHDGLLNRGRIKIIDDKRDKHKFDYAKEQIKKTYGNKINDFNNPVYEIEYFYEKNQILLQDLYSVNKKIQKKGYAFVSHNHFDISLSDILNRSLDSIHYCYNNFLVDDNSIQDKYNRKKLYGVYKLSIINGVINVEKINENKYGSREFKTFNEVETEVKNDTEKERHIQKMQRFIISTIKNNMHYILGTEKVIVEKLTYTVYVHCIRTLVSKDEPKSETSIPNKNTEFKSPDFDYSVTHLVNKKGVFGGNNKLIIKTGDDNENKEEDSFLLETPLDTIYYKVENERNNTTQNIEHISESIHLQLNEPNSHKESFRDVLIMEIKKT